MNAMGKAETPEVPDRTSALILSWLLLGYLCLLFILSSGPPSPVWAGGQPSSVSAVSNLTVCPDGPPDCDFGSIQLAVDTAMEGAQIKIAAGTYVDLHARRSPPGYLGPEVITQVVYLSKTLSLRGGYSVANGFADPPDPVANPTILDAKGKGRVLFVSGPIHPTVEGLGITGGDPTGLGGDIYAEQAGGGAYVITATATFSNNLVYGNTAGPEGSAGGAMLWRSDSIFRYNSFTGNEAEKDGGGLYAWLSRATIEHNTFVGNSAGVFGGGLHLWYGPFTVVANSVVSNTALAGAAMQLGGADGSVIRANQILSNTAYAGALYVQYTGWISPTWFLSNTLAYNSAEWGGAIYLMYGPAQFVGNQILNNTANEGGGVDGFSSDALFEGNEIRANSVVSEGGGLRLEYSTPTLRSNLFADNTARDGGGAILLNSPASLEGNTFRGNTAGEKGGALYLVSSPAQMSANLVLSNTAGVGGGAYLAESDADLLNNILAGNAASQLGSGLYVIGSTPRLRHTTIAQHGGASGTALWIVAGQVPACTVALTNTILVGHDVGISVAAGCTAILEATLWDNETDWAGAGTVVTGTVNLWGNPAFLAPAGGDYHIRPWSRAVDAGIDAGAGNDIDGQRRPFGAGFDLGADECAWHGTYLPYVGK